MEGKVDESVVCKLWAWWESWYLESGSGTQLTHQSPRGDKRRMFKFYGHFLYVVLNREP